MTSNGSGGLDVLILGTGVIGLTTAVYLAESGLRVEVRSATLPERTTSAAAGAIWGLYLVELQERVLKWSRDTLDYLISLAAEPGTGVRLAEGIEASRKQATVPAWAPLLGSVRPCEPRELPPGFTSGFRFTAPLLDMPIYLGYLLERFRAAGGRLRIAPIHSLEDAFSHSDLVINCTGLQARELADDQDVYPIRGQIVVIANPGVTEFFVEDADDVPDQLYILPHGNKVVLGGTAEAGSWELEPDASIAKAIVARCAAVMPSLATAPVLAHRVGIRPGRRCVRLDEQPQPNGGRLIHSYGHGGAGVTLSWGCAKEVHRMLLTSMV
jgi:D-amino-acid oxidase